MTLTPEFVNFDFIIKGLDSASRNVISDKTSLRAMLLLNSQAIDHNREPKKINALANLFP